MSGVPFFITESSANIAQKFGIGLNIYFRLPRFNKKANIGSKNTEPPILKIANAWTLLVAKELTRSAEKGVKSANNIATGIYAGYENCVLSIRPDKGGNIRRTINANNDMKSIRYIR